jgi:hypothetical protein
MPAEEHGFRWNKEMPGPLGIALVVGILMAFGKVVASFWVGPQVLIEAALTTAIVIGLALGHKWAYVLTLVSVAIGVCLSLGHSVQSGLIVLVLDSLVLIPVLICTDYFFPRSSQ